MGILHKISDEIHYIFKSCCHFMAMNIPNSHLKRSFYRIRGTKIGNHVDIAPGVFLEDFYPELITIQDNVDIGPNVVIVTHDSSGKCVSSQDITWTKPVVIENNVYLGAGVVILPGVRIGDHSIIGAGSVVTRDIPPNCVAFGSPARIQLSTQEWLGKKGLKAKEDSKKDSNKSQVIDRL
jgi:acetyltransferase-like isoleucine patch superfamily enzyme